MATDTDPLVAIQNAALERALLSDTDSSAYVLLAGALERARSPDAETGAASRTLPTADGTEESDSPNLLTDEGEIDADRVAGSLLTATLTATLAVRHGLGAGTPPQPSSPSVAGVPPASESGDRRTRLLLTGAMLAVERFDATTAEAAALAEVGVADFERQLDRRS